MDSQFERLSDKLVSQSHIYDELFNDPDFRGNAYEEAAYRLGGYPGLDKHDIEITKKMDRLDKAYSAYVSNIRKREGLPQKGFIYGLNQDKRYSTSSYMGANVG